MKIEDIKIGNWVLNPQKELIIIESIFENSAGEALINIHAECSAYGDSSIEGIKLEKCRPILLTEEILSKYLKNGFGSHSWPSFNQNIKYKTFNLGNCYLSKTYGNENGYSVSFHYTCGENNEQEDLFEIEYVHELQTAYKLFTGEDLYIKL